MQEEHAIIIIIPLVVVIFLVNIVSWKGNLVLDTSVKPTILTKYFPQTEIIFFFNDQKTKVLKEIFLWHILLLEIIFHNKNFEIDPLDIFNISFARCISFVCFIKLFTSFSNFFTISI